MITAFSGTSTERNTAINNRKLSTNTAPMKIGNRDDISVEKSTFEAVCPPTCASSVVAGSTVSRRRCTRSDVAASCGAVVGITVRIAASPLGAETIDPTLATPFVAATISGNACTAERLGTSGGGGAEDEGPGR